MLTGRSASALIATGVVILFLIAFAIAVAPPAH